MARKPKPNVDLPVAPDDASITGSQLSTPRRVDGRTPDPGKEQDARLETYEQDVQRDSVEGGPERPRT